MCFSGDVRCKVWLLVRHCSNPLPAPPRPTTTTTIARPLPLLLPPLPREASLAAFLIGRSTHLNLNSNRVFRADETLSLPLFLALTQKSFSLLFPLILLCTHRRTALRCGDGIAEEPKLRMTGQLRRDGGKCELNVIVNTDCSLSVLPEGSSSTCDAGTLVFFFVGTRQEKLRLRVSSGTRDDGGGGGDVSTGGGSRYFCSFELHFISFQFL
ncbi:hypothetical protein FN846DRAFT_292571 [Sphaerosporella brunnea]|uniref:Uncharacterized protein n=1 Tax=Sphaerosporella brunnea TaxID=1250544 RepID=A0A5J5EMY7_9PEZI|nr:hypothetical protein FN846DRAFT_292571 [Sphaerosporella brunnea]